jgi:hypothetical protein
LSVEIGGAIFIAAGGTSGYLQRDGIQIGIAAGSESAVLVAARALRRCPEVRLNSANGTVILSL